MDGLVAPALYGRGTTSRDQVLALLRRADRRAPCAREVGLVFEILPPADDLTGSCQSPLDAPSQRTGTGLSSATTSASIRSFEFPVDYESTMRGLYSNPDTSKLECEASSPSNALTAKSRQTLDTATSLT